MSLAQIQQRFNESTDSACELRIIAQDSRGLSTADRACIKEAADEHDELGRSYVKACHLLDQQQQENVSLRERQLALGSQIVALRDQLEAKYSWLVTINVPHAKCVGWFLHPAPWQLVGYAG